MIQKHLAVAKEMPLLLFSWLALVAFEDFPTFSDLTQVHAEHLIQSLLYRLRTGEASSNNRLGQNVKVGTVLIACSNP